MAWVRIHDGAMSHPKILSLPATAFRTWVAGLSYCQQHLTDGRIPAAALGVFLATKSDATHLVAAGLWHQVEGGYEVHDYLDWNNSREFVNRERDRARERATASRGRAPHVRRTSSIGVDVDLGLTSISEGVQGEPAPRPAAPLPPKSSGKQSGRLFLHRWQLDALIATLGDHARDFGLDDWLDALSRKPGVLPADRWAWVQAELHAEVKRRGLPVAAAGGGPTSLEVAEALLRRDGVIQ